MINSFVERLRKAAGVTTAKDVGRRREEPLADRDDSRQRAALFSYEATATPLIDTALTSASRVAHELPGHTLLEAAYLQLDDNILARRTFYLQRAVQTQRAVAREMQQAVYVDPVVIGSLHVLLTAAGKLHLEVSDDRPRAAERSDPGVPVHAVTLEQVEDAFLRFLMKAKV